MIQCVWNQLKAVQWWQWLILLAVAAAIALLIYFATPVLAAIGFVAAGLAFLLGLGIPLWAAAALIGLGSTLLFTVLIAIVACVRR